MIQQTLPAGFRGTAVHKVALRRQLQLELEEAIDDGSWGEVPEGSFCNVFVRSIFFEFLFFKFVFLFWIADFRRGEEAVGPLLCTRYFSRRPTLNYCQ